MTTQKEKLLAKSATAVEGINLDDVQENSDSSVKDIENNINGSFSEPDKE